MTRHRHGGPRKAIGDEAERDYAALLTDRVVFHLSPALEGCDLLAIGSEGLELIEVKGADRSFGGKAKAEAISKLRTILIQTAAMGPRYPGYFVVTARIVHRRGPEGEWETVWREER